MREEEFIIDHSGLNERGVKNTLKLLGEGSTIPFIARYRKEMTGNLDEIQIGTIRDLSKRYNEIIQRQLTITSAIAEQGKLSDDLKDKIVSCFDLTMLEDIYLPYKQKRLTKGDKAKKLGLEPLAKMIMSQRGGDLDRMASQFVKGEIQDEEEAIQGAKDIIAEWINENPIARERVRGLFERRAVVSAKLVKGKEEEADKYRDYLSFSEPLKYCAGHRFLAVYRGDREGVLNLKVRPEDEDALQQIHRIFVKGKDDLSAVVEEACDESYKRLMRSSIENEMIAKAKEKADKEAIDVFGKNLRQLLLSPPLGSKRILAIDPGFRTGCKVVCLSGQGELLTNVTIYPHPPQKEMSAAKSKIAQLVQAYKIEAIAIGDGTAGRETEQMVKHIHFDRDVEVFVVREDGASIYSASSIARKEFPDYDVTVRGAVSIGRRLMDPLAELVKIDPKSVGVGQYQHEVNQQWLKDALDDVVVSCVNQVGVDVNTASPSLLGYVSGLGPALAENIIEYRNEHGAIHSRQELKKVKRLGDKAFEQAAGFLRVSNSKDPLDNSAVHPESYGVVKQMAKSAGVTVDDIIGNGKVLDALNAADFDIDGYTFNDIVTELKKPGRDPRSKAKVLEFDHRLKTIEDLRTGMTVTGITTNVTNFGAFVNIGIKENGLIHKSNMADHYVNDPTEVVHLHQHVEVQVMEVDVARKRVGLRLIK